jgi:tetratricopeptide (TPR) repeat protein
VIGEQLGGYSIQSELGSGGMGTVYLAQAPQERRRVALKVLHPHLLESPGTLERFEREAEAGRRVQHSNVVRTFEAGSSVVEGVTHHYLVMEYVEGQTLRGLLEELGRVPEELCRHIGREVTKGLEAIHAAGVVHRDLKPENVLITEDHVVKVMDLGVAKLLDDAIKLSQTGVFLGSVLYAAPDQFRGEAPDSRADFYSLGLVLYELATGVHPFQADTFSDVFQRQMQEEPRPAAELNPQLSPFFEEVCKALLEKDRERRIAFLPHGEESTWWQERAQAIRLETKRPLRRIRIPRETALYGREDELAHLGVLYERAKEGAGQVLLVEGEAGIGKTRLIDEFVGRLRQEGEDLNFLFGSYPPGGAATAAGGFSTAYREHFGHEGLEEALAGYLTTTPVLVPAFAALLRGEPTPKGEEALTKDSLQTVFVHATRAVAAERPTLVLIDDLHLAPEEGRALFAALAMAVPDHPVLLVGTMRPGISEEWMAGVTRLEQCEQLSLSRLGPRDLVQLLEESFQSKRLAEELGAKIAVKSDGNPFFAFEIVCGLREGQFITQRADGSWATTQVIRDISVPSSVVDLVRARIAGLSEEERDLLDMASCCGFEFDPVLIAAAGEVPRIPALKRFAQIERRHRLVKASGPRYAFDHHQVQEALYGSLPEALRREYHTAIAEALEPAPISGQDPSGDLDGAHCAELCHHHLSGVSAPRALAYLDKALAHAPGVLKGERRVDVLLRKSQRLDLLGRREEQGRALEEAVRCATESDSRHLTITLHRAAGVLHYRLAEYAEAMEEYTKSRAVARELGDRRGEAVAAGNQGLTLMALGRFDEARAEFEGSLEIAREIGAIRIEANTTGNLGNLLSVQGREAEAREYYERWLELANGIGDRQGIANATGNLGLALRAGGRREEARTHLERSRAIAREIGDRQVEGNAAGNLGNLFTDLGQYASALEGFEQCLSICREIGARQGETVTRGALGNVYLALGSYEEARQAHERHLVLAREIGNRLEEGYALHVLGLIAEEERDSARAEELLLEALAVHQGIDSTAGVAEAQAALGRVLRGESKDRADRARDDALRLARENGLYGTLLLVTTEQAADGEGDVSIAVETLETHGERVSVTRRMAACHRLWKATGTRTYLEEAKRLLDHVVGHAPEAYRRSVQENVPLHRDIAKAIVP